MNFILSLIGGTLLGAIATWVVLILLLPWLREDTAMWAILIGASAGLVAALWSRIPRV